MGIGHTLNGRTEKKRIDAFGCPHPSLSPSTSSRTFGCFVWFVWTNSIRHFSLSFPHIVSFNLIYSTDKCKETKENIIMLTWLENIYIYFCLFCIQITTTEWTEETISFRVLSTCAVAVVTFQADSASNQIKWTIICICLLFLCFWSGKSVTIVITVALSSLLAKEKTILPAFVLWMSEQKKIELWIETAKSCDCK